MQLPPDNDATINLCTADRGPADGYRVNPMEIPVSQPEPARHIAGIDADLRNTLDRARDERLRLTHILKEAQRIPSSGAACAGGAEVLADKVADLALRVARLDEAITRRQRKLEALDERVEKRLGRLADVEQGVRMLSEKVTGQVETVRDFGRLIASARRRGAGATSPPESDDRDMTFRGRIDGLVAARRNTVAPVADADRLIDSMHQLAARTTRDNAPRQVLEFIDPDKPAAA